MDALIMEIATNIKAMLVKQDDMKESIVYLSNIKNRHEERISKIENLIPHNLDDRLRVIEQQIVKYALMAGIISTISGLLLSKIANLIIP